MYIKDSSNFVIKNYNQQNLILGNIDLCSDSQGQKQILSIPLALIQQDRYLCGLPAINEQLQVELLPFLS